MAAKGTHLHTIYRKASDRPAYCGNCVNNTTDHLGMDTHAMCGVTGQLNIASLECNIGQYQERVQSAAEMEHLNEVNKGGAFAHMRRALLEQAAEGERELVEFDAGLVMSPTPGRNVAAADYKEGAA